MKTSNKDLAAVQLSQAIEQLKQDDGLLLQAYCEYSAENGYNSVYDNDDDSISMIFNNVHDALRAAYYGDYDPAHAYFTLNREGNLQSFEYLDSDSIPIDVEELAEWLIDEYKLAKYGITVTTLDDMLASIEDNITDDETLLNTVCKYLHLNHITLGDDYSFYEKVNIVTELISDFNYEQLNKLIIDLNINYE